MLEILSPGEIRLPDGRLAEFANLDIAATAPALTLVAETVAGLLPWYGSVNRGAGAAPGSTNRPGRPWPIFFFMLRGTR